ncbi:MAG: hypothetical protein FWG99_06240 [Treponema sp.]|nr:hypothetical protein [Treponema sp.]
MRIHRGKMGLAVLFIFLIMISAPLYAQTADRLEALLDKKVISWSEAAVFVLEISEAEVFYADNYDAFSFALEQKWLPKNAVPSDAAQLNGIALLLMQSFDLKGGIFYTIAKSPHHAYRELVYRGIIRGNTDPNITVSGQDLLLFIGRILSVKESEEAL